MLNVIPKHIAREFRSGATGGSFTACAIHVDISGFTAMTESLLLLGKEGAEVLSSALNRVMKYVIGAIYRSGGFVTGFAGDSLTGVFPDDGGRTALDCAKTVQKLFRKHGLLHTPAGDFRLSEKIGIARGPVAWGITGTEDRKTFYYRGDPIRLSAVAANECSAGGMKTMNLDDRTELPSVPVIDDQGSFPAFSDRMKSVSRKIASFFVPDKVLGYRLTGEFRDVASVFVSIDVSMSRQVFDDFISKVLETVESMGGYLNSFDFSASPPRFLILFGAPVSFENNVQRAVDLADSLRRLSAKPVRIGIGYDRVYAGSIGTSRRCTYTVLGNEINLASRLMEVADENEILLTEKAREKISDIFRTRCKESIRLKGVSEPTDAFILSGHIDTRRSFRTESAFVGRTEELDRLYDFMKPMLLGRFAGVAYIHGEAGIGKSRLAEEAARSLGHDVNTIILECDKVLRNSLNPFTGYFREYFNQVSARGKENNRQEFSRIFNELLSSCSRDDPRSDPVLSELDRTESMLAALLGVAPENSLYYQLEPEQRFENTMTAIKEFFKVLSIQNPLVIIFEDLSRADPDTERVLSALTRNVVRFPMVILVTSRKASHGRFPVIRTGTDVPVMNSLLDTLDRESVIQFVARICGHSAGEDIISFVHRKTDGNPFFVEQFCLFLKENELIDFSGDTCSLVNTDIEVPESIRAVIIARLDRLSAKLLRLVQTAAVLGREFDVRILSGMLKGMDVHCFLREGEGEKIWSALSEIIYIFHHAMLRDAAYEMQLKQQLRNLHAAAAEAMKILYRDDSSRASDLAYHFDKAGITESAMRYTGIAASCAEHDYRNEEAISLYWKLLGYTNDEIRQLDIRSTIANILIRTGRAAEAEDILKENIRMAKSLNQRVILSDNLLNLGLVRKTKGYLKEAESLMKRSLSVRSKLKQPGSISHIIVQITNLYLHLGDTDKAAEYAGRGLAAVRESDNRMDRINILMTTASVQWARSDIDGAQESITEALRLAGEEDNQSAMITPLGKLGNCCWRKGKVAEAERHYREQIELAGKVGDKQKIGSALNNLGNIYQLQGKYSEAMGFYSRRLAIAEEMGDKKGIANSNGNIGTLLFSQGKHLEAEPCLETMLRLCREIEYRKGESTATGNLAALYLTDMNLKKAMKYAKRKLEISEQIEDKHGIAQAYGLMASVSLELENFDKAAEYFLLKLKKSREIGDKKGCAHANKNLGDIARVRNDPGAASTYLDRSIDLLRELGARHLLPNFLLSRAEIAFDLEEYRLATGFIDEARELAEDLEQRAVLFSSELLKASITAQASDLAEGIAILDEILSREETEKNRAAVHYTIYRLSGDDLHRQKALDLYTGLDSIMSTREIRENIRFLTDNTQDLSERNVRQDGSSS